MTNIMPEDWRVLKENANKIICEIDPLRMNDEDYLMLGASVAILDHVSPIVESYAETAETPIQDTPAASQAKPYADIVRGEIADCEMFMDIGEKDMARQVCEIAKYFLSKLKAQAVSSEDKALVRELWSHLNLAKGRLQ